MIIIILQTLAVLLFGTVFISRFIKEGVPTDQIEFWFQMFFSIGAIYMGVFGGFLTKKYVELVNKKIGGYDTLDMFWLAKVIGLLFFVIGITLLTRNLIWLITN